jgi:hypothetical protein
VPYEDDSRQRAFLDAVSRAGLSVIVKRLPPKGINRQVSVDLEMAADIVAFSLGHTTFSRENEYLPVDHPLRSAQSHSTRDDSRSASAESAKDGDPERLEKASRSVVVVCPSRELAYPLGLSKEFEVDTTTADFGQFNTGDVLKSAAKWIDLSDSETIWRD